MAINPPEGIADFLAFVSGMKWPEADEDLMRRVSEHYGAIATDLETLSGYVTELIPIVKNDFDGEAADSFLVAMNDLTGATAGANQLTQTAELSRQLSEVALKVANQVEYTKIMAILQLVQLLAEILFATLFSAFTFGSVWGPVSAMFAATREGLHHLFRWLLQTILSQTFIGITGGIFQDTVIQLYQLNAGHTTSWNTESLIDSIKQGALTGLVGGPLEVVFHYGGKMLGRLLGGRTPGSIISKRIDDVLNKADNKLGDVPKNKKLDVPQGSPGPKSKLNDVASKTDKELPPTPVNKAKNDATPPPVPPKTPTEGSLPAPAARPKPDTAAPAPVTTKPDTQGGVTAKDKPNAPVTGAKDAPAPGAKDTPAPGTKDAPAPGRTESGAGATAPGAGKSAAGDAPTTGAAAKSSDAPGTGGAAGHGANPLDELLATKEARSAFAKDVGELLGGVNRQLETGFMRLGEGTIAEAFADKMGDIFATHLKHEGADEVAEAAAKQAAREAGKELGDVLTHQWVRLGADHADLPELLTKAMGDLGNLAPLKNLADAMPDLFARSEHSNALARIFKQENPLQGSPMYQLGGAVASLLSEGTNEMLSEGFYNLVFGDGTFKITAGPFASGVAMGALSHGLNRMFEPVMVKYQNWVLSHQYAENPNDSKYFGLLHPINIASFVANMTGNPAPWPVPRPTSDTTDPSFTRDMKDMVKWVFSNPFTGTPFFSDTPGGPGVTVQSDGGSAFTPLDVDLGPSFADDIAKDPLFQVESDGDTSTDGGGDKDSDTKDDGPGAARPTTSSDLSSLLGDAAENRGPNRTEEDRLTSRTVTQSGGDQFAAPVAKATEQSAEAPADPASGVKPHPLQAEADRAAAEGLGYLLVDVDDTDTPSGNAPAHRTDLDDESPRAPAAGDDDSKAPAGGDDDPEIPTDSGDDGPEVPVDDDSHSLTPSGGPVRDIPSGIAVGTLSPTQTDALQAIPKQPGVFVVGMHTDPDTPHDPATVLKALTDAHDDGRLDGITRIQFTACNLASPVHETTVKTVMSGLWKHRANDVPPPGPLKALAADAPVWYVPTTSGDTTAVHLLTAQHIGLTPDGKIAVVDEGSWHEYGDGGAPDHAPARTPPDTVELPDEMVRFLFRTPAVDAEHPDAVKFGASSPPRVDNGEGSSSHAGSGSGDAPNHEPTAGDALASAPDALIEDLVLIRYREESEAYERRLAEYLLRLPAVRKVAELLAQTVLEKLRDTPFYSGLGNNSVRTPGAVGLHQREWERVGESGNIRERMTLFFNSLSSKALTHSLGVPPSYPPSIQAERGQRFPNPDLSQLFDLRKQLEELDRAGQRNSPEYARANARWQALDSVLRPFRAEQVKPELSTTEKKMAVDSKGKMRWIPGGSSFTISMDQPYQRGAEQAGRLVRSGTSGSAYYFHRYAQVMAERWRFQVDHEALRLAIIATFVGQGHHSLPEVLAGSAAFAENHGDRYLDRTDIQALRIPVREPAPDWDHYRFLAPLPEWKLRRDVALNGLFPHEIAENYRRQLTLARRPGGIADDLGAMDLDGGSSAMDLDGGTSASDPNPTRGSKRSRPGGDDRDPKRERQGGSPGVPEDSPNSRPGQLQPEHVSPADRPVTADRWSAWTWTPGRDDVPPPARVRTERFDPAADPDVTGPFPGTADRRNEDGTLAGRRTLISADVQRFHVPDAAGTPGGTVRLVQLTLPVAVDDSYTAADTAALQDRLQGLLDAHVNLGFQLPRTRDQLHIEVRLTLEPLPRDGDGGDDRIRVSRDAGRGDRSDQLHFRLHADDADPDAESRDDATLLHELLHYAGLPDRYHDAETLFRHTPEQADASGVMATTVLPDGTLPHRYLEAIEDVTGSGPVLHDNNGPGTWITHPSPVRDIPSGIAVGTLSPAQTDALQAIPKQPGVFVVGMHTDPDTPHDPATVLKALTDAHDDGRLDGITRIQFTACNLASPVHEATVKTVMSGLWKHRANDVPPPGPLKALAADAPVWYVPGGRLVTAADVSVTSDGRLSVRRDDAAWHEYADTGAPDHTPDVTAPRSDDLPDLPDRLDPVDGGVVKFGPGGEAPGPLSQHLTREHWGLLLTDPSGADLLAEVADGARDADGAWRTLDADAYRRLLSLTLAPDHTRPSDDDVAEAFTAYAMEAEAAASAGDGWGRLEAVANLVKTLHLEASDRPLGQDSEILVQRVLLDQGFPPVLLSPEARTTAFWRKSTPDVLSAELALGMSGLAQAATRPSPLPGTATPSPAPPPPEDALGDLLWEPDEARTALLRDLLNGAHTKEGVWRTLDTDAYLALRAGIEGGEQSALAENVRDALDIVFAEHRQNLARATGFVGQLKAVADSVLALHQIKGVSASSSGALTADAEFVVPRMLLDLGVTPVKLPDKYHKEAGWRKPNMPIMKAPRLQTFAIDVAKAVVSSHRWVSTPTPTSTSTDSGSPAGGPSAATGRPAGDDARPAGDHTSTPVGGPALAHPRETGDGQPARGRDDDAAGPGDWRADLDALGARTDTETEAYLVLNDAPVRLMGRSDSTLRTDGRPYTTLTKDLPQDATHWLTVRIPAGRAVDSGDGRLLLGKDDLAAVTVTGPPHELTTIQEFQRSLREPSAEPDTRPLPLSVLTPVGQVLHAHPGMDGDHPMVRAARRVMYAEASREAELRLGTALAAREDVHREVHQLVHQIWERIEKDSAAWMTRNSAEVDARIALLGSPEASASGSVGNDPVTLEAVVRYGNVREQMHLLGNVVHSKAVYGDVTKPLLKFTKPKPPILSGDWGNQQQAAALIEYLEAQPESRERDESIAEIERGLRTGLRPDEVNPPLSDRERAHALRDDQLLWEPGERRTGIKMIAESQVTADSTGGLMSAGTSNTTYFTLAVVHAMSKQWKITVDYQLLRLALLVDMLPVGHHTFHEIMRAADAFERDVLAREPGHTPGTLEYGDDWGRFRSLPPLTESELRAAMPGGRFPDEVALGLEPGETTPVDSPDPAHAPITVAPRDARAPRGDEWSVLLDRLPGDRNRLEPLLRELLGGTPGETRDWRRVHADSYQELRSRLIEDVEPDAQTGVRDELTSIMERLIPQPEDTTAVDPEESAHPGGADPHTELDGIFDLYYSTMAAAGTDRTRLAAVADVIGELQTHQARHEPGATVSPPPDSVVPADTLVLVQHLLVAQGYTPALLGEESGTAGFWQRPADQVAAGLIAGMGEFARSQPVRTIPAGIAVGPLSPGQSRALSSVPRQPGRFIVGWHTDPASPPDTDAVLKALTDAHDSGGLDGVTEIQFTACNLAGSVDEATVRTVMSGLWKHRANGATPPGHLKAVASGAPVWFVPGARPDTSPGASTGSDAHPRPGRLITAEVVGEGDSLRVAPVAVGWHEYSDGGAPDHTPRRTEGSPDVFLGDIDLNRPGTERFGTGERVAVPLSAVLDRDEWGALLPEVELTDDLGKVLAEQLDWHGDPDERPRLDADGYLALRVRVGDSSLLEPGNETDALRRDISKALDHYYAEASRASTDAKRLETVAELIASLRVLDHPDAEPDAKPDAGATTDIRILAQRFLLEQGYSPALLAESRITRDFWGANQPHQLAAELALGMASFVRTRPPRGRRPDLSPASVAQIVEVDSARARAASPDAEVHERGTRLLRGLLSSASSDRPPLDADAYLTLRAEVEGRELPPEYAGSLRDTISTVLAAYAKTMTRVRPALTDQARLKAVGEVITKLQKLDEPRPATADGKITTNVRILAQRLLLDQGFRPTRLTADQHTADYWLSARPSQITDDLVLGMAEATRAISQPTPSPGPETTTTGDGGANTPPLGTDVPVRTDVPANEDTHLTRDVAADLHAEVVQVLGTVTDEPDAPLDRRSELDALGTRTDTETEAYLRLPVTPDLILRRSDAFLRTGDRPHATLTTTPPDTGEGTLLRVTVPAATAVRTADGRLLVDKDDLARSTITAVSTPNDAADGWRPLTSGTDLPGRPLSALTRLGRASHATPHEGVDDPLVRLATRIAYTDASLAAERPLGHLLAQLPTVHGEVKKLVRAVWDGIEATVAKDSKFSGAEKKAKETERLRSLLGSSEATGSGSVGNDLATLGKVVEHGNIREQMHLLGAAVHGVLPKLGFAKTTTRVLSQEHTHQSTPDVNLLASTDLRPDDVVPPLSPRELRHAVDKDGRLTWTPGENHRSIKMQSMGQVEAQSTGGLLNAGTSNTAYFTLAAVHSLSERWDVPVDYPLLRLALLADMLPVRHHSFHEVMRAAEEFGRKVLLKDTRLGFTENPLDYADNWSRYHALAPLEEKHLRKVMPGGRFPDEVALGLEPGERAPGSAPHVQGPGPRRLRLSDVLPENSWSRLLGDGTAPDPDGRVTALFHEVLDLRPNGNRDWRVLHADSYLELRRRVAYGVEPRPEPEGTRPWLADNAPEAPPARPDIDAIFDGYYAAVAQAGDTPAPGRRRLTALVEAVTKLQRLDAVEPPETALTADVRIVAHRFLLDQGHSPDLLPADAYTPEFWRGSVDRITEVLVAGTARPIPAGVAVGAMTPARNKALDDLPPRPGVFVVGMHIGADGPPSADLVLKALTDAHDSGRLDGVTELQFTGCDLATPLHETTVRTVMSGLWAHRSQGGTDRDPLTALAADAPVWSVPGSPLFTARHVGITADGRITVLGDPPARWHRYTDTGTSDHTPDKTVTDGDGAPADAVRDAGPDLPDHPGAMRFGDEDEASLTVVFGPGGEPSTPRQVTVRFPEKGKSFSEDQRAALDAFARDLRPELERRRQDGEPKLEVTVTAGGNNRFPGQAKQAADARVTALVAALSDSLGRMAPESDRTLIDHITFDRRPQGLSLLNNLMPTGPSTAEGTGDNGEGTSSQQPVTPPVPPASDASAPPPPQVPWYVAHKALGDGRVTSVLGSERVAEDRKVARTELEHAGVDARTAVKVVGRLATVLSSGDTRTWDAFLRDGLVFRANGRVVVVTAWPAGLAHHATQAQDESAPYASRNQAVTNRAVTSGGNASVAAGVDAVLKLAGVGDLTGVAPSVKVQAGTTYATARTSTTDTQGAGRTVVKETHEFDGDVRVQVRVLDKDPGRERTVELGTSTRLRIAFPQGVAPSGDGTTWKVTDSGALKSVLSTVNAVAPGQLLADLASTLHRAGFAPDVTAAFVSEVTREFFNEKAFKDGNQWWSTRSLSSRVFTAGGFTRKSLAGHFLVGAELTGLQHMGETGGPLRVREDFSDAFGVKSSSKFGDKSGLTAGVAAPSTVSRYVLVPSVELAVNAARSHNFDVGGAGKSKAKLKHAEEAQAEYRAVARFHVEFVSSSKRPTLSFDSTLEMAVGVPASRAADFEARLLGPDRERFTPEPPRRGDTAPRPSARVRTVGTAVRELLRLARHEPAANKDVGAARPFPSGGLPDAAGLLKIARRHPIEIATPDGTLPAGVPWTSLRDRPGVSVVPERQDYALVDTALDGPAFRYHVDAAGQVTAAQRLGTSTFTELFGPLERGEGGVAQLTALSAARPWLRFSVHDGSEAPPHLVGASRPDDVRLVVHRDADGTLDVRGILRHPVEQAVRNLAADGGAAARPTRVYADVAAELEDFAALRGPVEVRIDTRYAHADELAYRIEGSPHLRIRQGDDPRRPVAYLMEVTEGGALLGPFRQRDFGIDPVEPPALASRTGLGPGVVGELPGAQKVLEAARGWLDTHLERTGLKRRLSEDEYAQFHRELTAAFGTPGMRARFAKLLGSGVPVVLKAGGQEIRLHLRTELRDLRGTVGESGLSLTRSATHTANQAVGVGDQVSFSVTGGGTLRIGTGGRSRIEVPGVKVGGGATLSNVKDSVTATVKASREQETTGEHTAFTYAAVHHLTATVHDGRGDLVSGSSLRVEGDDVSAVVRVADEHLWDTTTAHRASTGTVTVFPQADAPGWIDDSAVPEFTLPRGGLGGVHPEFLGTRRLTASASELVAEHGGGTPPKARDDEFGRHSGDTVGTLRRGLTPEIEDALTPNFLQSRFERLTGPDGAVFPLPPDADGRAQALVVRLRLGTPVHEGTGTGTRLAYGAETGTKSATADTGSYNVGVGLGLGGYASLDGATVVAGGSVDATRTRTDVRTVSTASTATSTVTYKGTTHRYRADAYYEISHHTWKPDGRLSTGPSAHSARTRLVKVDGGVELTVPDHRARALDMTVPGPPRTAETPETRSYVNADLAKAVSHVEKLDADAVLPEVRRLLRTLKGLPDGLDDGIPTDFSRGLASVFSPESLRAGFTALSTTSVRQLVKLRQLGGGTRLIGVRVTATVGDPVYVGPRDQVTLAVADTATRSTASASGASDKAGGQVSVTVKGTDATGLPRGGIKAGGGADTSVGRTVTDTVSERDQHSLEVTGTAQEFRHPVTYTVHVFDSSEPHQTVRMAGAALNAPAQWVDRVTDGRAGRWFAAQWGGQWEKLFPSGHAPTATGTPLGGEARLLVPDHLTRPGAGFPAEAVQVSGHVRPNGPTAVPRQVEDLTGDLAPALQALSLPGLDRVLRWLPAAASLPHRVAEGDTGAAARRDLAPATLEGLRTDVLTTEQNLRANVRRLLDGGYTVPVAGGEEITVRMVVHRTRHLASGEFDSNVETGVRERETERERERTTLGWSGSFTPDGRVHSTDAGAPEGPGVSRVTTNLGVPLGVGGERGHSFSTTRGETVDERDKKKGTQHYYEADVTWILTGSRKTTVEVVVDGGLIGLLHDDAVDGMLRKHADLFGQKPGPVAQVEGAGQGAAEGRTADRRRSVEEDQKQEQDAAKDNAPPKEQAPGDDQAGPIPEVKTGQEREIRPKVVGPPGIIVTPPADPAPLPAPPASPPAPAYRLTDYETAGTTSHTRRVGETRVVAFADGEDPIAFALNGPSRDAASFPAFRPVRPVEAVERPALRVSADHRLAVPDHDGVRAFYATADVVEEARTRLAPAAAVRLDVDPEAYVRFTRDGVEHTLLRVTVRGAGASGSAPLVLAGDPEGPHIALRDDARPARRDADMRRAVDANLVHYGPALERIAEETERSDPGLSDPRTVLARALADLHRVRDGGDPAALARAEAEAARAFAAAAGDAYGSPGDDWHVRLGQGHAAVTLPTVDWSF